ncbi:MAG: ATP-binding cassette domain-containing protein [Eubacteriales bacterium]|nr:ATP-binding cassette domain-containing protein [Eubacteriales bacterium]
MNIPPLSKTYGRRRVLDFPGCELEPGTVYAVIGANGSGKSTLARLLAGVLPADGGAAPAALPSVGYMPQRSFAFRMSVRANVALGGKDPDRAAALMEALGLTALASMRADKLSGGETARMALARLLMKPFGLLILDEPTAAMDMESTALAEAQIARYAAETGAAVLLVTHSLQQARRLSDRVLFLKNGQLVESGPTDRVLHHPEKEETRAFLDFYGS